MQSVLLLNTNWPLWTRAVMVPLCPARVWMQTDFSMKPAVQQRFKCFPESSPGTKLQASLQQCC